MNGVNLLAGKFRLIRSLLFQYFKVVFSRQTCRTQVVQDNKDGDLLVFWNDYGSFHSRFHVDQVIPLLPDERKSRSLKDLHKLPIGCWADSRQFTSHPTETKAPSSRSKPGLEEARNRVSYRRARTPIRQECLRECPTSSSH